MLFFKRSVSVSAMHFLGIKWSKKSEEFQMLSLVCWKKSQRQQLGRMTTLIRKELAIPRKESIAKVMVCYLRSLLPVLYVSKLLKSRSNENKQKMRDRAINIPEARKDIIYIVWKLFKKNCNMPVTFFKLSKTIFADSMIRLSHNNNQSVYLKLYLNLISRVSFLERRFASYLFYLFDINACCVLYSFPKYSGNYFLKEPLKNISVIFSNRSCKMSTSITKFILFYSTKVMLLGSTVPNYTSDPKERKHIDLLTLCFSENEVRSIKRDTTKISSSNPNLAFFSIFLFLSPTITGYFNFVARRRAKRIIAPRICFQKKLTNVNLWAETNNEKSSVNLRANSLQNNYRMVPLSAGS